MTTPFWCLFVVVLLPYVWAGVGGGYKAVQLGSVDIDEPRVQAAALTGAGRRAVATQDNAWEALPVFTAAVVVNHLAGAAPGPSAIAAIVFVVARIVHGVAYIRGIAPARVGAFGIGTFASLALFGLAMAA